MSDRLLDTNIVSYLMKGHSLALTYRPHLEGHRLAISFMTVAELYEGAYRDNWGPRKLATLDAALKAYLVVPYSAVVVMAWARIRAERRLQPISVDDAWIAASAIAHNSPLVTHNPTDFTGITGLQIITELDLQATP